MRTIIAGTIAAAACLLSGASAIADSLDAKILGQQNWEISFKLILDSGKRVPFALRLTFDGGLANTVVDDIAAWRITREDASRVLSAVCQYLNAQRIQSTTNDQMRIRLEAGDRTIVHSAPPGPLPPLLRSALDIVLSANPELKSYVNAQIPATNKTVNGPRLNFEVQHWLVAKKAFIGCFVSMSFTGSVIELFGDGVALALGNSGHRLALG